MAHEAVWHGSVTDGKAEPVAGVSKLGEETVDECWTHVIGADHGAAGLQDGTVHWEFLTKEFLGKWRGQTLY